MSTERCQFVDGAGVPMENNGCRSATHPTAISDTITEAERPFRQRRPDRRYNSRVILDTVRNDSELFDNQVKSEMVDSVVAKSKHKSACWGCMH